ncbi:MAG: hypothetical protein HQM04_00135 [Magnetococcales bacterium]|nr:hypothetical protein [Magnetococcales bacterium]MBF0113429.1 hypothetical protein [Magnetococcales bacterium]
MCAAQRHPAEVIPLVRVAVVGQLTAICQEAVSQGSVMHWDMTKEQTFARAVQRACNWQPCTYFYAGQAGAQYGNLVFAYSHLMEEGKQGSVSPCDSGGVYRGKCDPFRSVANDDWPLPAAVPFLCDSVHALAVWRKAFAKYLDAFFAQRWQDYCEARPPNSVSGACWGSEHLPARYDSNHAPTTDWPSWSWEVRIEERARVADGLLFWSATGSAMDNLLDMQMGESTGFDDMFESLLNQSPEQFDSAGEMVVNARVRSITWVQQNLNP